MLIELLHPSQLEAAYHRFVLALHESAHGVESVTETGGEHVERTAVVEFRMDLRDTPDEMGELERNLLATMKLVEQVPDMRELMHQNAHFIAHHVQGGNCTAAEQLTAGVFSIAFVLAWDLFAEHGRGLAYLDKLEKDLSAD